MKIYDYALLLVLVFYKGMQGDEHILFTYASKHHLQKAFLQIVNNKQDRQYISRLTISREANKKKQYTTTE